MLVSKRYCDMVAGRWHPGEKCQEKFKGHLHSVIGQKCQVKHKGHWQSVTGQKCQEKHKGHWQSVTGQKRAKEFAGKRWAKGPQIKKKKNPGATSKFFPGVKRLGYEFDHSPASSDKLKNEWSYYLYFTYLSS